MSSFENDATREQVETFHVEPDQVEGIEPPKTEWLIDQLGGDTDDKGQRIETFVSPRTFVTQEWALQNIGSQPKGTHVTIGWIAGYATGFERRDSKLPLRPGDAAPPPSVWIKGQFEATVAETGEVKSARWLILPRAAGELVEEAFLDGAQRALLDLEIGIEATGRSIPYAYTVVAYGQRRDEAKRAIEEITRRRKARMIARGQNLLIEGSKADA